MERSAAAPFTHPDALPARAFVRASVCTLLLATVTAFAPHAGAQDAQQSNAPNPYQGVSNPPPDSTITTPESQPEAKPAPGRPMSAAPAAPAAPQPPAASSAPAASGMIPIPDVVTGPDSSPDQDASGADASPTSQVTPTPYVADTPHAAFVPQGGDGTDSGIVRVEPEMEVHPALNQRAATYNNPDGDIVHPAPLPPGTLDVGTMIRARLLGSLSTSYSEDGETFRARVASDVYRGDQILIPVGAEIDGKISDVSTGHFAGHGSMLLHPDSMILPDGSRYHIYAQLTSTPESNTRVGGEGNVTPGSRAKKDEIEYGGGVGAGVVTGAVLGGPAGALAGTIVGASAVTIHLLLDHPQATLKTGTVLDFTLTEPLNLVAVTTTAASE